MKRKGQAWGLDLTIAAVIFTVGLVFFYFYALNQPNEAKETVDALFYDGEVLASSILSEGYPLDWNMNNVVTIGILTEGKINNSKLQKFYNLNASDYEKTKNLFNTRYDYYFFLEKNMSTIAADVEGIGKKPGDAENLVRITRFTIYQDRPITAYLYIWN